ncbi:MAG: sigma-70 family RNA polymerase sigma factor [Lentisphaerae bacterium]|nr:sigma-70 family RNA polymerase sigma factor [Lentisphaerota bacterium]
MASNEVNRVEIRAPAARTSWAPAEVEPLARRAQSGDEVAFDELVKALGGAVHDLAFRMTGNAHDADDMTQEVFLKLHRSLRKFRWQSKFTTWLFTLAANTCRSGRRRLWRIARAEGLSLDDNRDPTRPKLEPADPTERPEEALARSELREQIEAAVMELPDEYRMALVLRDFQGLAYEEIAGALGCSVGTVKSRLSRARRRVKERLVRQGVLCAANR